MHEFSLAQTVVETAVSTAKKHNVDNIKKIILKFGKFALVIEDQFRFCFDIVKKEYEATKSTELDILWIDGIIECLHCGYTGKSDSLPDDSNSMIPLFKCPKCGSFETNILEGTETYIHKLIC